MLYVGLVRAIGGGTGLRAWFVGVVRIALDLEDKVRRAVKSSSSNRGLGEGVEQLSRGCLGGGLQRVFSGTCLRVWDLSALNYHYLRHEQC